MYSTLIIDHPRYLEPNAGCKHFDVHGGSENIPVSRFSFDAKVDKRGGQYQLYTDIASDTQSARHPWHLT